MGTRLTGVVLAGLLGAGIVGVTLHGGAAAQTATPAAQRDLAPTFWRQARTHIRFAGGRANLTFIARYIAEGMQSRLPPETVWSIYGGMRLATFVNVVTLGEGEVDFAVVTPPVSGTMALKGTGDFPKAYPALRAVAVFPQKDWLGCAVRADLGVRSFEDIKARKVPLRIAADSRNTGVGFLLERLLDAYGISPKDLESWGGGIVVAPGPVNRSVQKMMAGEADAVCHEAWKGFRLLVAKMPVTFLPVSDDILGRLSRDTGISATSSRRGSTDRAFPIAMFPSWISPTGRC